MNSTNNSQVGAIGISGQFARVNKLITRDLNKLLESPHFSKYTKEEITKYLGNPYKYERYLRRAVEYLYGASPHFRRLIQYFVGLSDLSYIVEPYKIDPKTANARTTNINYRRTLNLLSSMSIKTQFPKILTVCLREDTFFGTIWLSDDSVIIQQLPSDYCAISTIEDNVLNVTFDFAYFDTRLNMLDYFPEEFRVKYDLYKKLLMPRWMELDAPTSFAIKCNTDILGYSIPPFAGILRDIYDLEDYRDLKLAKTALDNYAMLAMMLPMESDGSWGIDFDKAVDFWRNLDSVLPDEIGSVLTPMKIDKIGFEKSNTTDNNTITDAEESLFTAAGVSSLLFNNSRASANALLLSIKADQSLTYGIVKSIEDMVNRLIHSFAYGKHFKVNFLDVSPYNRKEVGDAYLKAASYGLPLISAYAASQGLGQAELDSMSFLEGDVLKLPEMFKPIRSSTQMTSDELEGGGATDEGGAPEKDVGEVSDSREANKESE